MKKTYIIPITNVVTIRTNQMLALSAVIGSTANSSGDDNGVTMGARDNNSWDIWGDGDYDED